MHVFLKFGCQIGFIHNAGKAKDYLCFFEADLTWLKIVLSKTRIKNYRLRLENATGYGEIWEIVKETVAYSLGQRRAGLMLFLDDLPPQLGAYHPYGTNNIILNRILVKAVEASTNSRRILNAFVYNLLLHEYLHALGHVSELKVRQMVYHVAKECFGEEHITTSIAKRSPWDLLKDIPLDSVSPSKRVMEIVTDFEKTDKNYIV
ncbi:MAG: hypothetical protein QW717_01495 [Candidatus Bathyarchaeia archaeon]